MSSTDGLSLTLRDVTRRVTVGRGMQRARRTILDAATLHVRPGEFIGLLGASGSGKSTLIRIVAGLGRPDAGQVALDGVACDSAALRRDSRIAYLPQDVIIHEQLTPRRALDYGARIKGLAGSRAERRRLVTRALERVGLGERMDVPIARLSGGQRKRAALAAELLGDPQVLLLDEATSGLDPASEEEMMGLFRSLADEGRTVICITHFPNRLAMCDRLIYLIDGEVVFFGTPEELKGFFGVADMESVYRRQAEHSAAEWRERFLATPAGGAAFAVPAIAAAAAEQTPAGTMGPAPWMQTWIQLRRYLDINFRDPGSLALAVAQAPIIALMVALVFGWIREPFAQQHAASTREVIFVLVLAVLWCAGTLGVREIVKERTIFRHESRFGIAVGPYLGSKMLFLGLLAVAQALLLLLIVRAATGLTGEALLQGIVLALTAVTGVALGLLISAASPATERAMTLLPIVLIGQAVFSSGLAHLKAPLIWFSKVLVPAFWGLDGLRASFPAALTTATYPGPPGGTMPAILGSGGPAVLVLTALTAQLATILILAAWWIHRDRTRG